MKRSLLLTFLILGLIIAFSCQKGNSTIEVNCAECMSSEPDSFELSIDLSILEGVYDSVYLQIYQGNVESGKLSWEGEVFTELFYHLVPVNKDYSVKAYYRKNDKTIIAVDGDRMVTRFIADACDGNCWIVKGGLLDVRLKYQ
ncbi:MAG: hypothetical protein H6540_00320 [Bacteroidales bacterium]|nr:hypothetical protein [Bacteroidales bacterium]MCB9012939.1 hypothetical protein [Bacteroidales bacterium]